MSKKTPEHLLKPYRVSHSNGDVIAGFDSLRDAEEDATVRNERAESLGIDARYVAGEKP